MYEYEKDTLIYDDAIEIDIKNMLEKILYTISKYWIQMLLVILIICEAVLSCAALVYKPQYTSYITYVVNKSGDEGTDVIVTTALGVSMTDAFESSGLKNMIQEQYEENPTWLNKRTVVPSYDQEANLLTLTMTTDNYYNTKSLTSVVENIFPQYASNILGTVSLNIIDKSEVEETPTNNYNIIFFLAVGVIAGIFGCICFVLIYAIKRKTIRRREDVKDISNLKCLEEVPFVKEKKHKKKDSQRLNCASAKKKNTLYGQSMQSLRQKIEKIMRSKNKKVLMVTSSVQGEGKSTVAFNLAVLLAQRKYKVILIDADLYHPVVATMLKSEVKGQGFVDYLAGKTDWRSIVHKDMPMDVIVGSEKTVSSSVLLKSEMGKLIEELKNEYDFVILDTPPTAYVADAGYIAKYVDSMLYVIRHDYAAKHYVEEGLDSIDQEHAEGIGYVLNAVDNKFKTEDKYGYRKYGYKSYSGEKA